MCLCEERRIITYREGLPPATAGDEGEALGLDGHARPLHVLLDVPVRENRAVQNGSRIAK